MNDPLEPNAQNNRDAQYYRIRDAAPDLLAACRIGADDGMDGDVLSRVAEHLREEANCVEDAGGSALLASWMKEDADLLLKKQAAQAKAIAKATGK